MPFAQMKKPRLRVTTSRCETRTGTQIGLNLNPGLSPIIFPWFILAMIKIYIDRYK